MNETTRIEMGQKYENSIHLLGKVGLSIAIVMMIGAPLLMGALMNVSPDAAAVGTALLQVAIVYWPVGILECLVYAPMLGSGASYLAFVTGNVTNLKLPCAMNAREICETEVGTPENDIVSTLSVATSAIITTLVIALGVVCLVPLRPVLESEALAPAFQNVIPALFGALGFKYFYKNMKIAILPLVLMCIVFVLVPSLIANVSMLMIVAGVLAIGIAYFLFKKDKL